MPTAREYSMTYDSPAVGFMSSVVACRSGYTVTTDEALGRTIELDHAKREIRLRPGMGEGRVRSLINDASLYLINPSWIPEFRHQGRLQVARDLPARVSSIPGWVTRCLGCARPLLEGF